MVGGAHGTKTSTSQRDATQCNATQRTKLEVRAVEARVRHVRPFGGNLEQSLTRQKHVISAHHHHIQTTAKQFPVEQQLWVYALLEQFGHTTQLRTRGFLLEQPSFDERVLMTAPPCRTLEHPPESGRIVRQLRPSIGNDDATRPPSRSNQKVGEKGMLCQRCQICGAFDNVGPGQASQLSLTNEVDSARVDPYSESDDFFPAFDGPC